MDLYTQIEADIKAAMCVYVHLDSELSKQLESLEMMHRRVDGLICLGSSRSFTSSTGVGRSCRGAMDIDENDMLMFCTKLDDIATIYVSASRQLSECRFIREP